MKKLSTNNKSAMAGTVLTGLMAMAQLFAWPGTAEALPLTPPQKVSDMAQMNNSGSYWSSGGWVELNGVHYFASPDGVHGRELWRTDGTESGTRLVRNIREGSEGSSPRFLTVMGNHVYFAATDDFHGRQLWRSDGTASGTQMVSNINPGTRNGSPVGLVLFEGALYFFATTEDHDRQLWRSQGTEATTEMVRQINPSGSGVLGRIHVAGDRLLFRGNNGEDGWQLWESRGDFASTRQLAILNPSGNANPNNFIRLGNASYFMAVHSSYGQDLWRVVDGEEPELVGPINAGGSAGITAMHTIDDTLFFLATDGEEDRVWYVRNDMAAPVSVFDLDCSYHMNSIPDPGVYQGYLYLGCDGDLYRVNADGGELLTQLSTASQLHAHYWSGPSIVWNNVLYFTGPWGPEGERNRLIRTDGTVGGTYAVYPALQVAPQSHFVADGSQLLISGLEPDLGLWRSDGTHAGTQFLTPIGDAHWVRSRELVAVGDRLVFSASIGFPDGVSGPSRAILSLHEGALSYLFPEGQEWSMRILPFTALDDVAFLVRSNRELWRTDGTPEGTFPIFNDPDSTSGSLGKVEPSGMMIRDGQLWFLAHENGADHAYWYRTDGTVEGTDRALDVPFQLYGGGSGWARIWTPLETEDGFLFLANAPDDGNDSGFWFTDGTVEGTELIETSSGVDVIDLAWAGDRVVFRYIVSTLDNRVGVLERDPGGEWQPVTVLEGESAPYLRPNLHPVLDPNYYYFFDFRDFYSLGDAAYFLAHEGDGKELLWVTDGTAEGTQPFLDPYPDSHANITNLNVIGGQLYFVASHPVYGREMWVTDGSPEGTGVLRDINPGGSSNPTFPSAAGRSGHALFAASDGVNDAQLWMSDGSEGGTRLLDIINPTGPTVAYGFQSVGEHIYFVANDGFGQEIWALSAHDFNTAPVAEDVEVQVNAGDSVSGVLQGSDADGDSLTFSLLDDATLGSLELDETTGVFTYTADAGAQGVDSLRFVATDGLSESDEAELIVTVSDESSSATPGGGVGGSSGGCTLGGPASADPVLLLLLLLALLGIAARAPSLRA